MAAQKIFSTLFVLLAALLCVIIALAQASPVPNVASETAEAVAVAAEDGDTMRDGRFYGMGGSQASAVAIANAGASGFGGGYPYGGGVGMASSFANANAGAGGFGYGK